MCCCHATVLSGCKQFSDNSMLSLFFYPHYFSVHNYGKVLLCQHGVGQLLPLLECGCYCITVLTSDCMFFSVDPVVWLYKKNHTCVGFFLGHIQRKTCLITCVLLWAMLLTDKKNNPPSC